MTSRVLPDLFQIPLIDVIVYSSTTIPSIHLLNTTIKLWVTLPNAEAFAPVENLKKNFWMLRKGDLFTMHRESKGFSTHWSFIQLFSIT